MKNKLVRYLIVLIGVFTLLIFSGCGSGDGESGVQSDSDYNATEPLIPIIPPAPIP